MVVRNPVDLGQFIRHERRQRGVSQAELCAAAGVSRRWLSDVEAGKSTAEIGLIFKVIHALGHVLEISHGDTPDVDLDDVLGSYGQETGATP